MERLLFFLTSPTMTFESSLMKLINTTRNTAKIEHSISSLGVEQEILTGLTYTLGGLHSLR